jgi:AraC-like DNA-binding protein
MKRNFIKPIEKLADFIDEIFIFENYSEKKEFILPLFANGRPTLQFQTSKGNVNGNYHYLTLFGQTVKPNKISFTENFTLIAYFFKPYALSTLFGFSAKELTDCSIDFNLLDFFKTNELQEKLLNANSKKEMINLLNEYVYSLVVNVQTDYSQIKHATNLINSNHNNNILKLVKEELFITERTLERKFQREVGLSPNLYRRIFRFNNAFQQLNRGLFTNLTDLAFSNNYSDQSHFVRTFKEFTNFTPTEYLQIVNKMKI